VFVLPGRGLCNWPIPRPEESYRLWRVSECDQVKINNLDTCCEQAGRRGEDCDTKPYKMYVHTIISRLLYNWLSRRCQTCILQMSGTTLSMATLTEALRDTAKSLQTNGRTISKAGHGRFPPYHS
jgi:hypothetical protein